MKLRSWALLFLLFRSPLLGSDSVQDQVVSRIASNLMCQCGCPHIIKQCGDECGLAPQLIQRITQLVVSGKTEEEVYTVFEAEFGTSVHAVPKAEGFNLLAWILPFAGLLAGVVVVVLVVRNLKPEVDTGSETEEAPQIDEKYRELLERELKG
jgi:cytochrome c-type biogenesis protein CcmH